MRRKPELLSPAGDLDKLKVSVLYGADAVYLGGEKYNLRSAAGNFNPEQMKEGVAFAHEYGAKVFVVTNNFFHDEDFQDFPEYLKFLESIGVDALIASDLGVIEQIKKHSNLEIHLSTQASCLNIEAARFWKEVGVKRIVLGREVSIDEAKEIKTNVGIEVEMFVHGSMCMAYSGNCTISNFTQGRDSNRGGCAHSCRFKYGLDFEKENVKSYFMSSKDLNGLELLPLFIELEIDSLKIEGRMKSYNYAGGVTKAYREGIDHLMSNDNQFDPNCLISLSEELNKVTHREYTQASLSEVAGESSIYYEREHEYNDFQLVGSVVEVLENDCILLECRSKFCSEDDIEIVPFRGQSKSIKSISLKDLDDEKIDYTKPSSLVKIPYFKGVEKFNIIRKRV